MYSQIRLRYFSTVAVIGITPRHRWDKRLKMQGWQLALFGQWGLKKGASRIRSGFLKRPFKALMRRLTVNVAIGQLAEAGADAVLSFSTDVDDELASTMAVFAIPVGGLETSRTKRKDLVDDDL